MTGQNRQVDRPDDESSGADDIDPALVSGLATGLSYADIGRLIGRSERTVRRRAAVPAVREAVAGYRRDIAAQAAGRLVALMDDAVNAMAESLAGDQALRAADMIMRHASRLTSETYSQARMRELAAEIARLMNDGAGHSDAATGEEAR
jgi:hypothetical protein